MQQGTVLEWHISEGDDVSEDDVLVEVETEKSVTDIVARESGTLERILVEAGETVETGTPLAVLVGPNESAADLLTAADADVGGGMDFDEAELVESESTEVERTPSRPTRAPPRVRRLARELSVDLSSVEGTGDAGLITEEDVRAAASSSPSGPAALRAEESRELTGTRRAIAERLGKSYREAVHVTVHREVSAEDLLEARDQAADSIDPGVSLTDIFIAALSAALTDNPSFNATFVDGSHRLHEHQHVGIAVDREEGLVAPVLQDVEELSLGEIAEERSRLVERTRAGEYDQSDLEGGTFTISNLGPLDVDYFTPIINPPQVAILGLGRVSDVATPAEGGGVVFEKRIRLSLSFDHRVVDGADAARFLDSLAGYLG